VFVDHCLQVVIIGFLRQQTVVATQEQIAKGFKKYSAGQLALARHVH
jgi:hypothetical protein